MRHVVGERAKDKTAASVSQMGRFETEILTQPQNLNALINQSGQFYSAVYKTAGQFLKQVPGITNSVQQ